MSKGGGKGGSTTTIQKADPWIGVQPGLNTLYDHATRQYAAGNLAPQYYPGETIAPSNWNIDHSLNWGKLVAEQGAPGTQVARNQNVATMRGDYLNSNPHLDAMYRSATDPMVEQFQRSVAPGLASQFSLAGRMGSGSHQAAFEGAGDSLARGLGTASAQIYGGNYQNERARQMQAMGMAPALESAMYEPANRFMQMGQYQQAQQQDRMNADRQRYEHGANIPLTSLQNLNQILQGGSSYAGSTQTSNQSLNRNPFASALGGAATMSSIGGALGSGSALGGMLGGPLGLLGGALLGGLFG